MRLNRAREEAEASWEEGGRCTRPLSPRGLLLPWREAGYHPAEEGDPGS